jgi:hypothetical protein
MYLIDTYDKHLLFTFKPHTQNLFSVRVVVKSQIHPALLRTAKFKKQTEAVFIFVKD